MRFALAPSLCRSHCLPICRNRLRTAAFHKNRSLSLWLSAQRPELISSLTINNAHQPECRQQGDMQKTEVMQHSP